jgi:hypothetical protein
VPEQGRYFGFAGLPSQNAIQGLPFRLKAEQSNHPDRQDMTENKPDTSAMDINPQDMREWLGAVELHSLTENINATTPSGKLTFHIFAALADFERDILRARGSTPVSKPHGGGGGSVAGPGKGHLLPIPNHQIGDFRKMTISRCERQIVLKCRGEATGCILVRICVHPQAFALFAMICELHRGVHRELPKGDTTHWPLLIAQ